MWRSVRLLPRPLAVLGLLMLCPCTGELADSESDQTSQVDACRGMCSEVELCASDKSGGFGCARFCANQLHCWSGCCLPLERTGYNVCRPTRDCFPE